MSLTRVTALVAGLLAAAPIALRAQLPSTDATDTLSLPAPLRLEQVLEAVETTYPPLLAALIERDIRQGRFRSARGVFDVDLFSKFGGTPDGYYEYSTLEAGAEQFLGVWGSTVYGGYRLTEGEELPDYYRQRTNADGEGAVGLRVPILRGGAIDKARAGVQQAEIENRAAGPVIDRQRLDFGRAASVSYWKWVASGRKLELARQILEIAETRQAALEAQAEQGLVADITLVDNRRLVVSRELEVIAAERDFQAAALSLSLFFRLPDGTPVVPGEQALPDAFPVPELPPDVDPTADVARALARRPELQRLALEVDRVEVERRLARNTLLPYLNANVELADNWGDQLYVDRSETELRAAVEFKLPLQRREARGKVQEVEGKLGQARQKLSFARDKVAAEVQAFYVTLRAALDRSGLAAENVQLALELQAAEQERFRLGDSDLLALQLREQAAFDAQLKAVDALLDFHTAVADYRAAIAEGLAPLQPGS
jgi:outer membrane protein TolC